MRLPRPDGRTIGILLAIALALLVLGLLIRGAAYLLVLVAVVLGAYLLVTRLGSHRDPTG